MPVVVEALLGVGFVIFAVFLFLSDNLIATLQKSQRHEVPETITKPVTKNTEKYGSDKSMRLPIGV